MGEMGFRNRAEAGRQLAEALWHLQGRDVVVLGPARGGVPVAFEVAQALAAPLEVIVVCKIGVPWQPELAMGAVGEDAASIVNPDVVRAAGVEPDELADAQSQAQGELARRVALVRVDRPRIPVAGRTAVIVDDGMVTGATVRVACQVARGQRAARVVVAVPVAPGEAVTRLRGAADEVVCPMRPGSFGAVGQWYDEFGPTSDEQIVGLLSGRSDLSSVAVSTAIAAPGEALDQDITVRVGGVELAGHLTVPTSPAGLVVFAHGSGSSRHSPRNRYVAGVLRRAGLGTLLFDLLTPEEETDTAHVFDIGLLGRRLAEVVGWLRSQPVGTGLPIGVLAAGTGAGGALWAAAEPGTPIAAVVCRSGRPDLAGRRLVGVRAPTLLIVGGHDHVVAELNRAAQARLRCANRLALVPNATHLFEEPGALSRVAGLAGEWFTAHLLPNNRGHPRPVHHTVAGVPMAPVWEARV
jgi:putative phosphoribosyl transferase